MPAARRNTTRKATVTTGGSTNNTTANSRDRACVGRSPRAPNTIATTVITVAHAALTPKQCASTCGRPTHTIWVSPRRASAAAAPKRSDGGSACSASAGALPTLRVPVAAAASPFDAETQSHQ